MHAYGQAAQLFWSLCLCRIRVFQLASMGGIFCIVELNVTPSGCCCVQGIKLSSSCGEVGSELDAASMRQPR
jgi:hypothetical protein